MIKNITLRRPVLLDKADDRLSGWQGAQPYQREMLDAMTSGDVLFVTKRPDTACGAEPRRFDALAHIRDVAAGRK